MKRLEVSRRSFVGNRAYIPSGTVIPENVLIALNTSAPANELMKNGDTWFGLPSMIFHAREKREDFPAQHHIKHNCSCVIWCCGGR